MYQKKLYLKIQIVASHTSGFVIIKLIVHSKYFNLYFHFHFFNFSARKPGADGEGGVESWDGLTPLHLSCANSQDKIVQCLIEHNADINAQVCYCHLLFEAGINFQ